MMRAGKKRLDGRFGLCNHVPLLSALLQEREGKMHISIFMRGVLVSATLVACATSQAAYTAYIYQNGPDVKATGSGSINFAGLGGGGLGSASAAVHPAVGQVSLGDGTAVRTYAGGVTGPLSIGIGGSIPANLASGHPVIIQGLGATISIPSTAASGDPLSSDATWNGTTIAGLGITPGTYTWSWGAGATADSYTLHVGMAPPASTPATIASIPTLSEWGLIGLSGLIALFGLTRVRRWG